MIDIFQIKVLNLNEDEIKVHPPKMCTEESEVPEETDIDIDYPETQPFF
jgi:hypothetical protein